MERGQDPLYSEQEQLRNTAEPNTPCRRQEQESDTAAHVERRQDPLYRGKEQLRNPTNHFTKCQNPVYHDEAQQSVTAAHAERHQDPQ